MHESYVVAKVPSAQLKQALEARAGAFADEQAVRTVDSADGNYIGEHCGSAYVFDGEMTLGVGLSPDLFTNLSGELNTTVVACGYETVSGTYRFLAAERGKVLRYLSTSTRYRKPFTMGSPLPSEARTPLHTVEGIHAALTCLGFDVAGWHQSGSKVRFVYADEWVSEEGPLQQAHAAHEKEHGIPFDQWMQEFRPQVVLTHSNDPSASIIVPKEGTGFKVEMRRSPSVQRPSPTVQKKPWHKRLREWFDGLLASSENPKLLGRPPMDEAGPRSGQGSPRDELNALLNAAIDMGFKLIAKHGSHIPFAMAIGSDGQRINLAVDDSQTQDVDVLTGSLLNQLRSMCGRNELRAIAFARNVEYRSAMDGSHVDAIQVNLDHVHGTAVTCMLPYRLSDSGQPAPGELFAIDPQEVFFRRSDGK